MKKGCLQEACEWYDDAALFMEQAQKEQLFREKLSLFRSVGYLRPKIIFFVKPGLDTFINPIVEHLPNHTERLS
ncbi:hypothetical protein QKW52_03380 [Bacillus sonorensis]|nr:hypothetical protein [Bacillus sonorensis]